MGILDMVNVELSGIAVVKLRRNFELPAEQAKRVLADDEEMKTLLAKDLPIGVTEWDLVFGNREAPNQTPINEEEQGIRRSAIGNEHSNITELRN